MATLWVVRQLGLAAVALMNTRKPERDWFDQQFTDRVLAHTIDAIRPGFRAELEKSYAKPPTNNIELLSKYAGEWNGDTRLFDGSNIPLKLLIKDNEDVHITVDNQFTALIDGARLNNGLLVGRFPSSLPNDEGFQPDHVIRVNIRFNDSDAEGYLASNFRTARGRFDLPSYVHMERADGVGTKPTNGASEPENVFEAIQAMNRRYIDAYSISNPAALAAVYHPFGSRLDGSGRVSTGRAEIEESVNGFMSQVGSVKVILDTEKLWVAGEFAYEAGKWNYTYKRRNATQSQTVGGRYVTTWRRQSNGDWLMWADLSVPE